MPITPEPTLVDGSNTAVTPDNNQSNYNNIHSDVSIMLQYIVNKGIAIPSSFKSNDANDIDTAIANYNELLPAIAPATVQSIKYIDKQTDGADGKTRWYKIPVFKKCLIIAIISLIALISVSLSPEVNAENQSQGLLVSSGFILLVNLIFICSAALMGVMFYLLKTISDKIKNYSLIPADSIELDATILIGVISGFIISELFAFTTDSISSSIEINKMTLALLGGFSSDAIFTVLQGVVNKVKLLMTPTA